MSILHVLNNPFHGPPKKPLIFSCNLTPRPSCIEMRDWWHEDQGLHSLKTNQKSVAFWSFAQYSENNCKQRQTGAS
ncbi:hypothetical protein CsSME_00042767 [Camellia sinensis var. sinensis]